MRALRRFRLIIAMIVLSPIVLVYNSLYFQEPDVALGQNPHSQKPVVLTKPTNITVRMEFLTNSHTFAKSEPDESTKERPRYPNILKSDGELNALEEYSNSAIGLESDDVTVNASSRSNVEQETNKTMENMPNAGQEDNEVGMNNNYSSFNSTVRPDLGEIINVHHALSSSPVTPESNEPLTTRHVSFSSSIVPESDQATSKYHTDFDSVTKLESEESPYTHNSSSAGTTSKNMKQKLFNSTTNTYFNESFIDLLPRSVYFDSRSRDGHDNATVILVQVSKTALKEERVVGCGVDKHFTDEFKFEVLYTFISHVHKHCPELTHDQAMLTCYDLPARKGSRAFVFYKDETGEILKLEAEKKIHIPQRDISSNMNQHNASILVCTTVYGKPPWFREWLLYQKTIGVDFVHIYAQESFINEGGMNNSVLRAYLDSGYATLDVWKAYLNKSQDFYYQQPLLYQDCIYRYRTVFDYAFLYDTDDFFSPRIPGKTDVHFYSNYFFHKTQIGTVSLQMYDHFPECGLTARPENIHDGNVTNYLAFQGSRPKSVKSMHKLSVVVEAGVHNVMTMLPGYKWYGKYRKGIGKKSAPLEVAYIAHIRRKIKPTDKEQLHQCLSLLEKENVYVPM